MEATGFNFGVDPQELILTLVAFSVQHDFFEMLYTQNNILGWLTVTFGLIGFVSLVLLPANWTGKVIFPWLFLMIVLVARPLGDPFFFSDPITSGSNVVNQPVCPGGVLNQEECKRAVGSGQAVEVKDILEKRGNLVDSSFKMFTPIAATLHLVNSLREGIAVELTGIGANSIDKHITSIETVRRSATASGHATYALANFQSTCGQRDASFARIAALPYARALEGHRPTLERMKEQPMSAVDGLIMFNNYASFQTRGKGFAPPLICATSNNLAVCEDNAYTKNPIIQDLFGKNLRGIFGAKTILLREPQDFERVMAIKETPTQEGTPDDDDPDTTYNREYVGIDEVKHNLENEVYNNIGGDYEKLAKQPVTIAMPLNAKAIMESRYADMEDFSSELEGIVAEIEATSVDTYTRNGAIIGAIAGGVAIGATVLFTSICGIATGGVCFLVVAGMGLAGGALLGAHAGEQAGSAALAAQESKAMELADRGVIMSVDNCADLYMFTNIQLSIATINFSYLRAGLAKIIEENKDLLKENANDLMGLPARERMDYILNAAIERNEQKCEGKSEQTYTRQGMRQPSAKERCEARNDVSGIAQMQALLSSERVNQSQAATAAFLDQAHDPKFGGVGFQLVSDIGEKAGPFGIWFKTILGGFGAGTYSAIMPILVSYATALIIIMTPLLFMIGLAVPTWAAGVILLPIVVVGYFQLTKVIFVLIGIISSVFIAARDANLITGMTAGFADLVMATAYTAAFLVTGIIMFALKNPFGAVQQVAGGADKTSTISGQEALQMAGAVYGVTQIPGKASAAIEGYHKVTGTASANLEATTGLSTKGLLSKEGQIYRGKQLSARGSQDAQAAYHASQNADDYTARESGKLTKSEEGEMQEQFIGNNNGHMMKTPPKGLAMHNGNVVEVDKIDNAFESLEKAAKKAGAELSSVDRQSLAGSKEKLGGRLDKDAYKKDGTIAYSYNPEALKNAGVKVDALVDKGQATYDKDEAGNKVLRIVEHKGLGGGNAGSGGSDIKDRLRSSAERNKPNRPKRGGGDDDNS